ncbi:MAG: dienelactone hydrolase family protein [Acidimicrobiia bacterium]|nr:dienelactone hydrolase family protein [Acidimicrobiia bacterium]
MLRLVHLLCLVLPVVACTSGASLDVPSSAEDSWPARSSTSVTSDPDGQAVLESVVEQVTIESVRLPGRLWDPLLPPLADGVEIMVGGSLTIPVVEEPAPAVIIAHGCGGPGRSERDWATELSDHGIAVLVLDSFGARGVAEVCSGRETINVADPVVDVYRAAELLRDHPRVDGDRVAVTGFSFGGRTALWSALARFQDAYGGRPFDAYVAFYPSTCFIRLEGETEVVGGPIRILHGTADDWTPIEPCQELVNRLDSAGVDAAVIRYDGAYHGFDNQSLAWGGLHFSPNLVSPRNCSFVEEGGVVIDPDIGTVAGVDSPCVERGARYAYDADAREAAERYLIGLLLEVFER